MTLVEALRARWISKRNEYINGTHVPGRIYDGPDDYARRERRAYRLAQVWSRDESLPGEWWWVRRDQRWDVYPQKEPCTLMRIVWDGHFSELFYPDVSKARISYILGHRARARQ